MTRVFDALRREQERRKKEMSRDPLAAETGAPEEKTDSEVAAAEFELPSVIGSPVAARPNEGMATPVSGNGVGEAANHHAAPINAPVNGSRANDFVAGNALGETAPSNHPPSRTPENRSASRVVEDIRSRQTETQRLREELSLQTAARASREIPIERLVT
ncbi:MAG: hypothetical protein ACREAM_11285, partial [Blastocatellia bacterium]